MNEEDILAALEESVDYSGGFVSSFTLPLSDGGGGAGKPLVVCPLQFREVQPCSSKMRYMIVY
jgi:hypothetical protein